MNQQNYYFHQSGETTFLVSNNRAGDPRFHAVLAEMGNLHDKKQADYGLPTDAFSNIRAGEDWGVEAWVSALIRANDKVKRLQKVAQGGELSNEGVEDSLIDLANYAVIALVLYREKFATPKGVCGNGDCDCGE